MQIIFIVEDDKNIAEIEAFALKNAGYEALVFGNAKDFFKALEEKVPSLILMDIMLPDRDGLSIVKELRTRTDTYKIPIIMVTAKSSEIDKVKGLDQGADDYMTKPFGVMEMISRVKALLRRTDSGSENVMEFNGVVLDDARHQVTIDGKICELTYKEYQLLKMFLQNPGIVLKRERILDRVWGFDYEGESRTLDMHIKTLRKKMGQKGSLIHTVRNVGYTLSNQKGD